MTLLSVAQAYDTVMAHAPRPVAETIPLERATGRVLLEPVHADRDYPPIDRATMDGIALALASWQAGVRRWRIEGTVPAGVAAPPLRDAAGGCLTIMTGAEVPAGCDGIIPFEQVAVEGDTAVARNDAVFQDRQFIHDRASDRRQGDALLAAGQRLDAPRIAILAAVGHTPVQVARPPRVAVISTGNEIVPVTQRTLAPAQSRASNAAGLAAALHQLGVTDVAATHIPDDIDATVAAIARALRECDLLLLTGGVSKGHYDYVPAALTSNGVAEIFHGVAQKPGKPLWFGRTENATVFGLPGNPVSTLTVFRRYTVPFLHSAMGLITPDSMSARVTRTIKPHLGLTTFPPVNAKINQEGQLEAEPVTYHGSGDFAALSNSNGFLEIPPGENLRDSIAAFRAW